MGQIKNRAGQVFADFNEWKKWAEQPSEQYPGYNNVLPELVEFLGFYPYLLKVEKSSEYAEKCTDKAVAVLNEGDEWASFNLYELLIDEVVYTGIMTKHKIYANMKLSQKEDGTYKLERIRKFEASNEWLVIPDGVTEIEPDALTSVSWNGVTFPYTFNTDAKIKVSLASSWGSSPSINTIYPLNIEVQGVKMDDVENGRFNIKYTTFKHLCELYPDAFKPNDEGKIWADISESCLSLGGGRARGVRMIMLSESEKFVQIDPDTMFPPKPYDFRCYDDYETHVAIFGEEDVNRTLARSKQLEDARIVAVELVAGFGEKHPIVLPASVDTLFVNWPPEELVLEGNPHNVFFDKVLAQKRVVVNAGIQELNSREIFERYRTAVGKDDERIIFNLPQLCEEKSVIPGYIRATLAIRDRFEEYDVITEINTKYIVSYHPQEITLRNKSVTGTIIHMASNGIERHQSLVVYEPMEMIAEKIKNA